MRVMIKPKVPADMYVVLSDAVGQGEEIFRHPDYDTCCNVAVAEAHKAKCHTIVCPANQIDNGHPEDIDCILAFVCGHDSERETGTKH